MSEAAFFLASETIDLRWGSPAVMPAVTLPMGSAREILGREARETHAGRRRSMKRRFTERVNLLTMKAPHSRRNILVGVATLHAMSPIVLQTRRLALRHLCEADAPFIFELLNDPAWVRYIGNKSVHCRDGALEYIAKAQRMYAEKGFGLWAVERREDAALLGLCGLIKRDTLRDVDLGFGFLTRHHGRGYGHEAAAAVLEHGLVTLAIPRIVAITSFDNAASSGLLEKLGFAFERAIEWTPGEAVKLYAAS